MTALQRIAVPVAAADPQLAALLRRLRELIGEGRAPAARALLAAVAQLGAQQDSLAELQSQVLELEGQGAAAVAVLDTAIASGHDGARLRLRRAQARLRQNDSAGAASDAAEALFADPGCNDAKACLGIAMIHLDRLADAIACLGDAAAAVPGNPHYRQALAHAQEVSGAAALAMRTLDDGIAMAPGHLGLRVAAILLRLHQRDYAAAEALAAAARRDGVADACVLGLLGHARSSLGRHDAAAEAYAEARKLAPEDPYVNHLVAAAGLSADAGRAAPEYVEVVFDGYASRFDAHLISLGYRIPGLIRAALADAAAGGEPIGPVLDLGCGTGLVGVALSDLNVRVLIGVDLSSAMLAQAARRGLYAELHHADVEQFLAAETRQFPLILAGDLMPYFGDLAPLCRLAAGRLAPGGRLLFSVEALDDGDAPWRLGRLGRYAHGSGYVRALAESCGLTLQFLRRECVRLEGRAPVTGFFACLHRSAA